MTINIIILIALIITALWTVMTRSLLRAGMGLAITSAILSVIMFKFNSPLAAVFELSVCAGLIPVLFISTISLTEPLTSQEKLRERKDKLKRFWYLPVITIAVGVVLILVCMRLDIKSPNAAPEPEVRFLLWNLRQLDIVGQIIIILAGVFGVAILFKERQGK